MKNQIRRFEMNPQIKKFTEPKELKRIHCVIQTQTKVIQQIVGLEPMVFMYLWKNMKKNQFALVFDEESKLMLGYISKDENGIPKRYLEPSTIYFNEMYEMVGE